MKDPSNIKQWKFSIVKSPPWQYSVGVLFHLQYISQNSNPTLYMSLKRERSMTPSKPSLQCLTMWTQCTRPSETAFGSAGKVIFFFFCMVIKDYFIYWNVFSTNARCLLKVVDHLLLGYEVCGFVHKWHQRVQLVWPVVENIVGVLGSLEVDNSSQPVNLCIDGLVYHQIGKKLFRFLQNSNTCRSKVKSLQFLTLHTSQKK